MREVVHGRVNPRVWALALLTVALCVFAFAAPVAASSPAPVSASPRRAAAAAPPHRRPPPHRSPVPFTLTCVLSGGSVVFGDAVTVSGVLDPATEAQEVVVTFGASRWAGCSRTRPGPTRSPSRRAAAATWSPCSAPIPPWSAPTRTVAVKPKASVSHGTLVPFLPSTFTVKVAPAAYDGVVVLKVVHRKVIVGTYKVRVR